MHAKTNRGATPMTVAIEQHNALSVRMLIQHGYNMNKRFKWGETPLDMCLRCGSRLLPEQPTQSVMGVVLGDTYNWCIWVVFFRGACSIYWILCLDWFSHSITVEVLTPTRYKIPKIHRIEHSPGSAPPPNQQMLYNSDGQHGLINKLDQGVKPPLDFNAFQNYTIYWSDYT